MTLAFSSGLLTQARAFSGLFSCPWTGNVMCWGREVDRVELVVSRNADFLKGPNCSQ